MLILFAPAWHQQKISSLDQMYFYKQKKNELFNLKLKLQEEKAKVETTGAVWLEPMREFVNCALQAQKIARKK